MAKGNLSACLAITLEHEGGLSMIRSDPGNWTGGKVGKGELKGTKYGVAASAYPNLDIQNLRLQDVQPIYRKNYWDKVRAELLAAGVDLAAFDYAVNSGPSRSVKDLQRVVGAKADGVAGPETLKLAAQMDGKTIIQKLCARRMSFLQGLAIWNTFKRGWTRRVADVEAKGVAMWLKMGGASGAVVSGTLKSEAVKADKTAAGQNKGAAGAGAGGAGVGGGDAVVSGGDPNWMLWIVVALVLAGALVLFVKSRQNKERADAYAAVAIAA